jgi:hypothetical protein
VGPSGPQEGALVKPGTFVAPMGPLGWVGRLGDPHYVSWRTHCSWGGSSRSRTLFLGRAGQLRMWLKSSWTTAVDFRTTILLVLLMVLVVLASSNTTSIRRTSDNTDTSTTSNINTSVAASTIPAPLTYLFLSS